MNVINWFVSALFVSSTTIIQDLQVEFPAKPAVPKEAKVSLSLLVVVLYLSIALRVWQHSYHVHVCAFVYVYIKCTWCQLPKIVIFRLSSCCAAQEFIKKCLNPRQEARPDVFGCTNDEYLCPDIFLFYVCLFLCANANTFGMCLFMSFLCAVTFGVCLLLP